jgi:hypothetical protein
LRLCTWKFKKSFERVSVDLDILVKVEDTPRLLKPWFIGVLVLLSGNRTRLPLLEGDLLLTFTHPSFTWVVYMDGEALLECCVEEVEVGNLGAKALSREVWGLAVDYGVEEALEELLRVCSLVRSGVEEAPCKLRPHAVLRAYVEKTMHDPSFRSTLPNILRYVITRRDIGEKIIARITRRSY